MKACKTKGDLFELIREVNEDGDHEEIEEGQEEGSEEETEEESETDEDGEK
jgi:hypothetical protein